MVTEPGTMTDVGRSPGTSLNQDNSGATTFEEQRENGIHKVTTVLPDGTQTRTISQTNPSTGITTTVTRQADGRLEREVEWPGGQKQVTVHFRDGSTEMHRTFQGPDGTSWGQTYARDKDGEIKTSTSHDAYQPDGTLRHTVKHFDGSIEVTKTKTTKLEDGSEMTKVTSNTGDETTSIVRSDGTRELTTRHKDGSYEYENTTRTDDGKLVTHARSSDGTETTVTNWTSPEGHEHRTVENPDGSRQEFESWEDRNPDGSSVLHINTPDVKETITNRPDGSTERTKLFSDGRETTFTRTKDPDGTIHEHSVRHDGSTRDATYTQNPDGSCTTHTRDFDGTEKTTMVGRDGRVEINTVNPDGSRVQTSYSSDGSGRTDMFNADGHLHSSTPIQPDPRPVPHGDYDPERFIDEAQGELGPDVPIDPPAVTGEGEGFAAVPLSDDQVNFLEERGIAPGALSPEPDFATVDVAAPSSDAAGEGSAGFFDRSNPGPTMLDEKLPDGTHKVTSVDPNGTVMNLAERTDPSTGIETEVVRFQDGWTQTTIDSPGGFRQVTRRGPDGSEEIFRAGLAPDGSQWSQSINADGVKTTRMTFEPDGTLRSVEKLPDGTIEVTTTKTTYNPDGTSVTEVHAPNGDVSTMISKDDGTAEMRVVHPDGSQVVTTSKMNPDGSTEVQTVHEDGSVDSGRKWTSEDGHSHEELTYPDGRTEHFENWGEVNPDGSSYIASISPTGSERIDYAANGSIDKVKTNADGTTETYKLTKNPDGSMVEVETRADGATRECHYEPQGLDGSYTTITRDFDGIETRTTMDDNGRISVRAVNPDGTSVETDYNPDGSGRTVTLDAAGNVTVETRIDPAPPPTPADFEPDKFLADVQKELPPDVLAPEPVGVGPDSRVLTDAEVDALSERGIAPIGGVAATELDDATVGEALAGTAKMYAGPGDEIEMPPGAIGDPGALGNVYRTVDMPEENIITPEPYPEEQIWPGEEKIEDMPGEEEMDVEPVAVDGPEEDIILPEPAQEEPVWPGEEETTDMEPVEEHDPIGPDPAVEQQEP